MRSPNENHIQFEAGEKKISFVRCSLSYRLLVNIILLISVVVTSRTDGKCS